MARILVIPVHNIIKQQDKSRIVGMDLKQGVLTGSILADLHETHILIPDGLKVNLISNWTPSLRPINADVPKEVTMGCARTVRFTKKIYPLIRRYDVVFNYNAAMTMWLRSLPDCPPIVTTIDNPSSVAEWDRNPIGQWEFTHALQILEAGAAIDGPLMLHNPDDYNIIMRQIPSIFSSELSSKALANVVFIWNPIVPVAQLRRHSKPKNGVFEVLIAGGFGPGREGLPKQAMTTLRVLQKLRRLRYKVKLTVCSSTPESDWTHRILKPFRSFTSFFYRPNNYAELFDRAHIGIALREISDGSRFTLSEMMMNGKPVIWLNNRYIEGWTDPELMPYHANKHDLKKVSNAMIRCMRNYEEAAELALRQGAIACNRHHRDSWRDAIKPILEGVIK